MQYNLWTTFENSSYSDKYAYAKHFLDLPRTLMFLAILFTTYVLVYPYSKYFMKYMYIPSFITCIIKE